MVTPLKKLGQNFLQNQLVVDEMVAGLSLEISDIIVEIGPGLGVLTTKLSHAKHVYAIEFDERLTKELQNQVSKNIEVINKDFLEWFPTFDVKEFKLLGSLPYYITSPILHALVKREFRPRVAVVMIQKEVAEKVCADENNASYLSSFIQTFFDTQVIIEVSREDFYPIPEVDSTVIRLTAKIAPSISISEVAKYEKFLHHVYKNPRKMLNKVFAKEVLTHLNLDGTLRPQNITPNRWAQIFKSLDKRD